MIVARQEKADKMLIGSPTSASSLYSAVGVADFGLTNVSDLLTFSSVETSVGTTILRVCLF